ncbi:hypothetical protein KFK09_023156 [Dendrobium nobile]|uniref:Alpha-amylase/branching enzyme C-terminal all beta domain-containing protein n=1 Tax=Dendrobium nobile TaxID=94219 RepID=A0A8T3ALZ3_DENNO|nr:hypothetical protein KFK09_023156 [Dendrobium nobile]
MSKQPLAFKISLPKFFPGPRRLCSLRSVPPAGCDSVARRPGLVRFMISRHQYISRKDEGDKMIIFERGDLVFVFNFHWSNSYFGYRVGCLKPGKYKVVLDSDDKLFGGFGRINPSAEYFSTEGKYDNRPHSFQVYAPSRTAVVYALTED